MAPTSRPPSHERPVRRRKRSSDLLGDAQRVSGNLGQPHKLAELRARERPCDEERGLGDSLRIESPAADIACKPESEMIGDDMSGGAKIREIRLYRNDLGMRRARSHDNGARVDRRAAVLPPPAKGKDDAILFGRRSEERSRNNVQSSSRDPAFEHGFNLWRDTKPVHVPEDAQVAHDAALRAA